MQDEKFLILNGKILEWIKHSQGKKLNVTKLKLRLLKGQFHEMDLAFMPTHSGGKRPIQCKPLYKCNTSRKPIYFNQYTLYSTCDQH
jgi:hypothetical protein